MSEKPITQRIKDRLAAYTAMLRDIDNQSNASTAWR